MQQLSEKIMTDEETDDDTESNILVKRTPPWRSNKLTKLIKTLDTRKDAKADAQPKKGRKTGHPSERSPPRDLPKWALKDTSERYSSSLSDTSSPVSTPASHPTENPELTQTSSRSPFSQSSSQALTPLSHNQSSRTPLSHQSAPRTSAPHSLFHSPPVHTLPATSRVHSGESSTSLSPIGSTSNEDSLSENDDDDTSVWIRALTGVN